MTTYDLLLVSLLAGAAAIIVGLSAASRRRVSHPEWEHAELRGARVAMAEKQFRTSKPFELVARVDRGYEKNGTHYLMELKTRQAHRVHRSDLIELSAQRLAVVASGLNVSFTGFVMTAVGDTRKCHRVELMGSAELTELEARRRDILAGTMAPRCANRPMLCAKCPHKAPCQHEQRSGTRAQGGAR